MTFRFKEEKHYPGVHVATDMKQMDADYIDDHTESGLLAMPVNTKTGIGRRGEIIDTFF